MAAGVRRGEGSRPLFELVQGRSPLVCCCLGGGEGRRLLHGRVARLDGATQTGVDD